MVPFLDSLKIGFAHDFLRRYHANLIGDTRAVAEYAARPLAEAVMLAPGRMVDAAEAMLASYRKNDNSGTALAKPKLPMMIYAIGKDMSASPPDWSIRQTATEQEVVVPGDPLNRVLRLRTVYQEFRAQVAFFAPEPTTANSLAMQMHAFATELSNRRFACPFKLAGVPTMWPAIIENPDVIAVDNSPASEQSNLTILVADFTIRATIPLLQGARPGEPNDGQGSGTVDDPNGLLTALNGIQIIHSALSSLAPNPMDYTVYEAP